MFGVVPGIIIYSRFGGRTRVSELFSEVRGAVFPLRSDFLFLVRFGSWFGSLRGSVHFWVSVQARTVYEPNRLEP